MAQFTFEFDESTLSQSTLPPESVYVVACNYSPVVQVKVTLQISFLICLFSSYAL